MPAALYPQHRSAAAPVAALIGTFVRLAAGVRTTAEFANHLAFLMLDLTDPEFQEVSRDYAHAVEAALASVLDASRAVGELQSSSHDAQLARAVHVAYNGTLVTWGMSERRGLGLQGRHTPAAPTAHPTPRTDAAVPVAEPQTGHQLEVETLTGVLRPRPR